MWKLIQRLGSVFFILLFIILTLYLFSLNFKRNRFDILQTAVLKTVVPLAEAWTGIFNEIRDVWDTYVCLVNVQEENRELKEKVARLEQDLITYREAYLENQRLKHLLGFRDQIQIPTISAIIVFHDLTGWFQSVLVNKGSKDGVLPDMPVVSYEGVIGRILSVGDRYSRIMLITDPASALDVVVQRSQVRGILIGGEPGICQIKYVRNDADVKPGDVVITTGKDGVFPGGIKTGIVKAVFPDPVGIFQRVDVIPAVDVENLGEVLIIQKEPAISVLLNGG